MLNFSTFSIGGCWGQPMLLFWNLVNETPLSKPLKPSMLHNSKRYINPFTPQSHLRFTLDRFTIRHPVHICMSSFFKFLPHNLYVICHKFQHRLWFQRYTIKVTNLSEKKFQFYTSNDLKLHFLYLIIPYAQKNLVVIVLGGRAGTFQH